MHPRSPALARPGSAGHILPVSRRASGRAAVLRQGKNGLFGVREEEAARVGKMLMTRSFGPQQRSLVARGSLGWPCGPSVWQTLSNAETTCARSDCRELCCRPEPPMTISAGRRRPPRVTGHGGRRPCIADRRRRRFGQIHRACHRKGDNRAGGKVCPGWERVHDGLCCGLTGG